MSKRKSHKRDNLLPVALIAAAVGGDVDAINKVLKHFEGYIVALSTKRLFDEYGNAHLFVDEETRRTLETRLIVNIMRFDMNRVA